MAAYTFLHPLNQGTAAQNFTVTGTNPLAAIGMRYGAIDPNYGYGEFIYCRGNAASSASSGAWVVMSNFSAVLAQQNMSVGIGGPVGVVAGDLSATSVYGWVQVYGVCDFAKAATNNSIAAGRGVFIAATAGRVNSSVQAGTGNMLIFGAVAGSSYTSSQSNSFTAFLNNPQLVGNTYYFT